MRVHPGQPPVRCPGRSVERVLVVVLGFGLLGLLGAAWATPAAAQDDWDDDSLARKASRIAFGFGSSHGNSDTFSLALGLDLIHRWTRYQNLLDLDSHIIHGTQLDPEGERVQKLTQRIHLTDTVRRRLLSGPWHLSGHFEAEQDITSGIDLRLTLGPGAGFGIEKKRWQLALDSGVALTREDDVGADPFEFLALWLQQGWRFRLTDAVTFLERVRGSRNLEDSEDLRLRLTFDVLLAITDNIGVQATLEAKFDNQPVPGFERFDGATTMHMTVSF